MPKLLSEILNLCKDDYFNGTGPKFLTLSVA